MMFVLGYRLVWLICISVIVRYVFSAQDTGHPAGLFADCPGMNKTTKFTEATKNSLHVKVLVPSSGFWDSGERRCKLSVRGAHCAAKYLDWRKKTHVLISGYMGASFSPTMKTLTLPYAQRERNVIIAENFPILMRPYPLAARVTKPLGILLGDFLAELTKLGLSPDLLELIGGSLGAHIASFACDRYFQITGHQPARLTGLDPAGPCFRNAHPLERFHPYAARRVDALHTNIDGFGIADAIAQVDFYANGGEFQPAMLSGFILPCFLFCSHSRSDFYWVESFNHPEKFMAVRCDSVADARRGECYNYPRPIQVNLLGPRTNFSRPGVYFLPTLECSPYYLAEEGLKPRRYGTNHFLLNASPDEDIVV